MACAYGRGGREAGFCGRAAYEWEGGRGLPGNECSRGRGGGAWSREGKTLTYLGLV